LHAASILNALTGRGPGLAISKTRVDDPLDYVRNIKMHDTVCNERLFQFAGLLAMQTDRGSRRKAPTNLDKWLGPLSWSELQVL
jgi:hypothetical protein